MGAWLQGQGLGFMSQRQQCMPTARCPLTCSSSFKPRRSQARQRHRQCCIVLQRLPLASSQSTGHLHPAAMLALAQATPCAFKFLVNPHRCMPSLSQTTKRSSMQRLDRITCLLTPAVSPASTLSAFRQAHPGVQCVSSGASAAAAAGRPYLAQQRRGDRGRPSRCAKCGDRGQALGYDEACRS